MASDLPQHNTEAGLSNFHLAKSREGKHLSLAAIWSDELLKVAPWSKLSWGVFLPLVFLGNVLVAILAWFIVGLAMR
jgi:hypothetical protein